MAELKPGLEYRTEVIVEASLSARAMGSGDMDVFATPAMVALMESAAMNAVAGSLKDGESTVGTFISVSHVRATPIGALVWATAKLAEVDGRELTFEVVAGDGLGTIGHGRHKRFVILRSKFLDKVALAAR